MSYMKEVSGGRHAESLDSITIQQHYDKGQDNWAHDSGHWTWTRNKDASDLDVLSCLRENCMDEASRLATTIRDVLKAWEHD